MLLKLLIYLEGNWKNICKTRVNIVPENAGVFDKDEEYSEFIEYEFTYKSRWQIYLLPLKIVI